MGHVSDPPQHPTAWTKAFLGWSTPNHVTTDQASLPLASHSLVPGAAYRLWSAGASAFEYFLVEVRTQDGFDASLPGEGVLIYHVDEELYINDDYSPNGNECHPLLDVESADQFGLDHAG